MLISRKTTAERGLYCGKPREAVCLGRCLRCGGHAAAVCGCCAGKLRVSCRALRSVWQRAATHGLFAGKPAHAAGACSAARIAHCVFQKARGLFHAAAPRADSRYVFRHAGKYEPHCFRGKRAVVRAAYGAARGALARPSFRLPGTLYHSGLSAAPGQP